MAQRYPVVFDWIDRLKEIGTADAAWLSFLAFAGQYGFSYGAIVDLPGRTRRSPDAALSLTWPKAWRERYVKEHYLWRDPSVRALSHTGDPFTWKEGLQFEDYDAAAKRIVHEAGEFGLHGGFVVPLQGLRTTQAVVTLAGEAGEISAHDRVQLHLAAIYAHTRIRELFPKDRALVYSPALTERECECLEWVAMGKSDWEIGGILSISERTAGVHVESAKRKFGVGTRLQAVIAALRNGAIRL